ncbi:IPT/TIG domain-containing protein [Actinomycetospora sp. TBRC 11914]|uniref:IPT/TIG domain-containing protein n=1 Tax=Actinomycetospora sp. TBRC 11914 TaxID=2729387 RepID=UPI00145C9B41|nr:IPT/TIG domain-containing protein [Actinomycetospora sp. TBRC 11914]NMO88378.1 hypothetical protein [Actinomycetospora sp. TBRC 11914]
MATVIDSIEPVQGPRGTVLTIEGSGFSAARLDNEVEVGGAGAFVLSASPNELRVLTDPDTDSGSVRVTTPGGPATSPTDFTVVGFPLPGAIDDGPPVVSRGVGDPRPGDVSPIGTIRVLVVVMRADDTSPPDPAAVRTTVDDAWSRVDTYYRQASYGRTDIQTDLSQFVDLDGPLADFVDTSPAVENLRSDQLGRIAAIGAQGAVDQGFHLDDYAMACFVVFTNGTFVRAWGGGSQSTFSYDNGLPVGDPNRIHINLTASHQVNTLYINETANWGRFAHEFGHNVVSAPNSSGDGSATLGEDVYGSDLVDPTAATAQLFELMGAHDTHPLFSGYHLEKLGYYQPANITTLDWDRNPFSETFEVVAHGLTEDTSSRVHLVKVRVSDALSYYVQVRQRPGTTAQVFDDQIPVGATPNNGGVIVTRAISGVMNNNQQTRFLSLLHTPEVLGAGGTAEDPARALKITVLDDSVQARPLVCRVRVEWAQTVADDPTGAFDLRIEPWDSAFQSPDIWVDRNPFGTFDKPSDSEGRPTGNGDKPQVAKINHVVSRVRVSGALGASNVKVTHYAVTPPGVGDNGNWAPISVQTIPTIAANDFADVTSNWVPVVGRHTCLRAFVSAQFGEISGQNNGAQENVSDFISAGSSPCDPVLIRTAVRNPVNERRPVFVSLHGVPRGWSAQIPHAWIWLEGLAEKEIDVAIWPEEDLAAYAIGSHDGKEGLPGTAPLRVSGTVPREYSELVQPFDEEPGARFAPVGGVFYPVHVRRRARIEIGLEPLGDLDVLVFGRVDPAVPGQRVVVSVTAPSGRQVLAGQTATKPGGSLEHRLELASVVKEHGSGIYTVQAEILDADELDDATSNKVQRAF